MAPSTPEWKRVDLNGDANAEDDDGENDGEIMAALQVKCATIHQNVHVKGISKPVYLGHFKF
jgi:hypothetical protein